MNNPDDLTNLTQKLLVLAGCDASILLTESWILSTLKIDLFGLLCYSFKEFGHCFALLLAFLPLHNLCIDGTYVLKSPYKHNPVMRHVLPIITTPTP